MTDRSKPRLLDLFCCAGGCTKGYQRAGFWVRGVDREPQKRYCGDEFVMADALEYLQGLIESGEIEEFDAIHASPPCQFGSNCTPPQRRPKHPNLIPGTRELLRLAGKPYVMENVANVRFHLDNPLMLCGSMFGLGVWRHRYFEIKPELFALLPPCNHTGYPVVITGTTKRAIRNGGRLEYSVQECRDASGIAWMTRAELDQAIPPVYTEWMGRRQLIASINQWSTA